MPSPPSTDDHLTEHVPWEHLTIPAPRDHRRLWYAAAAAVVVVALVWTVASNTFPGQPPYVPEPVEPAHGALSSPLATDNSPGGELAPPSTASLLSEADLRAVDVGEVESQVRAFAEMVAVEYFSLDPNDDWPTRLAPLVQDMPADVGPGVEHPSAVSYVEWSRTWHLTEASVGVFTVDVLIRRLVALDGEAYQRLPVELVEVTAGIAADGQPGLLRLPRISRWTPPSAAPVVVEGKQVDLAGLSWPRGTTQLP